jgi:hypothetical protein
MAAQSFAVVTTKWKYVYWYYGGGEMIPTEELFNMQKDRLELSNAAKDPAQSLALKNMRRRYDRAVGDLKENAVNQHRVYTKLFDRELPWKEKAGIIK